VRELNEMVKNKILLNFIKDHDYQKKLFNRYANAKKIDATETTDIYNDLRNSLKRHDSKDSVVYSDSAYTNSKLKDLIQIADKQSRKLMELLEDIFLSETKKETIEKLKEFKELLNKKATIGEKQIFPLIDIQMSKNGSSSAIIDDLDMYDPFE